MPDGPAGAVPFKLRRLADKRGKALHLRAVQVEGRDRQHGQPECHVDRHLYLQQKHFRCILNSETYDTQSQMPRAASSRWKTH